MKKTLTFAISIAADRTVVWETMLGPETYRQWTAPFCEGTYYEGSWDEGARIRFLAPGGDGMVAEIAENRPLEFISIRHIGEIKGGVEDTESDSVRAWAPAYENFAFADSNGETVVTVQLETLPEYEACMSEVYPRALSILKSMCETAGS